MVHNHILRGLDNKAVHVKIAAISASAFGDLVHGIPCSTGAMGVPFIFHQLIIIFWVDDSEFALRQRNFTKCVSVAQHAPGQERQGQE
jgi:hypothetical protein